MRAQAIVSAALFAVLAGSASGQQMVDSAAWTDGIAAMGNQPVVRWRFNTSTTTNAPTLFDTNVAEIDEITAVYGQVDIHPFGDEFYLSAGTIAQRGDRAVPVWMRQADAPAWSAFPHAELSEELTRSNLDALTRYIGAGITVRTIDAWSVTMEGGAYFQDSSEDRLILFDPETGTQVTLLDDMDDLSRDAVGETQSRGVRPVGHLVLRRRF